MKNSFVFSSVSKVFPSFRFLTLGLLLASPFFPLDNVFSFPNSNNFDNNPPGFPPKLKFHQGGLRDHYFGFSNPNENMSKMDLACIHTTKLPSLKTIVVPVKVYADMDNCDVVKFKLCLITNLGKIYGGSLIYDSITSIEFEIPMDEEPEFLFIQSPVGIFCADHITTQDIVNIAKMLLAKESRPSPVNHRNADANCDGHIDIRDCLILYWKILAIFIEEQCLSKGDGFFLNDNFDIMDDTLQFNEWKNKGLKLCLNQRGNMNETLPNYQTPFPSTPLNFPDPSLYWEYNNTYLSAEQKYELTLTSSDSHNLYGIQGNIAMDENLVEIDSVYADFEFRKDNYSVTGSNVLFSAVNISSYGAKPKKYRLFIRLKAKSAVRLKDVFLDKKKLSHFALKYDRTVLPMYLRESMVNQQNDEKANNSFQIFVSNGTTIAYQGVVENDSQLDIYNINGKKVYSLNLQCDICNGTIPSQLTNGIYLATLSSKSSIQFSQKLVITE